MNKPSIGRIVHYKPTEAQIKEMNDHPNCNTAKVLPAIIVAVWDEQCVNLKVICDGEINLWVTSSKQGDGEYEWNWPQRN